MGGTVRVVKKHLITFARGETHGQRENIDESHHNGRSSNLRLPFKEKLSYGIGDLASNILLDIGTLYLLKFLYRRSGAAPGTYGGIIF